MCVRIIAVFAVNLCSLLHNVCFFSTENVTFSFTQTQVVVILMLISVAKKCFFFSGTMCVFRHAIHQNYKMCTGFEIRNTMFVAVQILLRALIMCICSTSFPAHVSYVFLKNVNFFSESRRSNNS